MRNRVLLHKLKFDSHGDFDRSAQNSKTAIIAHLDMSSAVANTHYWSRQTVTTTFRGQTVRVTRFDMTWVGYGHTHCSDWTDATDLTSLPWEVKLNTATNRYEFAGFSQHYRPLTVGVKPTDWDTTWQWKYYTKYDTNFYWADSNSVPVTYPRGINNNTNDTTPYTAWDSNTQYYVADNGWEVNQIWVTDRMLTFGGWQSFETYGTGNTSAYMCGLVNGYRSLGVRLYTDGSNQSNWGYKGGRVGFAQLSTDTNRITSYCDSMNPTTPSGGHVNTYRSNVPFVENAARTQLINNGKWSVPTFCRLVAFTLDSVNYIGFLMGYENSSFPNMPYTPTIYAIEDLDDETLSPWGVEPPPSGGYSGPTSRPGGGSGTYTDTDSGIIRTAINGTLFTGSVSGGFKTYDIDSTTLNKVINGIFSGTYSEKMVNQMNTGIVDCYGLAIPASSAGSVNISVLGEDIEDGGNVMEAPIISPMQEFVSCGSISLGKFYDSFLDFDPFTTLSIYLPFIGKFDLPTNEFMYATLTLKYIQDNYSGDLLAIIEASGDYKYTGVDGHGTSYAHPVAEFSGNGKYTIPINVASKNNIALLSTLSAGGKIVGGVVTGAKAGGALGPEGAAIGAIVGGAAGAIASYPDLVATGSAPLTGHSLVQFSGNQSWLSCMTPYIVITRSMYAEPSTFGNDVGYRSNISYRIGDISGWTICKNADLSVIMNANDREKAEILALIKSGIYVGGSV